MKKLQSFLTSICLLSLISLNSDDVNKNFQVSTFNKIDIGQALNATITQGNTCQVIAHGSKIDIEDLIVSVDDNVLSIEYKKSRKNRDKVTLEITCPELLVANISGACNAKIKKFDNMDALSLRLSGASDVKILSNIKKLKTILSGASELELTGNIDNLAVKASGASSLKIEDGSVNDAKLVASGASDLDLTVLKTLDIVASGASSINYSGTPQLISMNSSGSSSIRKNK